MNKSSIQQKLRIVLAIAAKDTLDALKNRTILALFFGILVLMLSAKALPLLIALRGRSILAVYDPAGLPALQTLETRQDMQLVRFDSEQEMKSLLVDTSQQVFGLVIPDEAGQPSGEMLLDGYYPNWASPSWVREQVLFYEAALSSATGAMVRIDVEGHKVTMTDESAPQLMMVTQTATLMILLMGLILVPYLFLDEKEQHTLDALLVSPATYGQLVTGKAVAGGFYCLIAAVVVMLFNFRYIVHWELALPSVLLGGAFAVLAGLLLGILVENQASLGMWMGLLLLLLAGPSVLLSLGSARLPAIIVSILSWTPGVAFNDLLKFSMLAEVPSLPIVKGIGILAAGALIIYPLVVWRIRQLDR